MVINSNYNNYAGVAAYSASAAAVDSKAAEAEKSADSSKETAGKAADTDRVEFSSDTKVVNKMSDSERSALVESLKADLNNQMTRFTNMMTQMFNKQGITGMIAGGDDFWHTIASGNFTVDAQTKAEAQAAISEDGFWGVSQTSQRIFDFAAAWAGDDVDKMKEAQAAVEKGFKQATAAWGRSLPGICQDTHEAITKKFDEFYKNAGVEK